MMDMHSQPELCTVGFQRDTLHFTHDQVLYI